MTGSKAGERGRSRVCRNLYVVLKYPSNHLDGEDKGKTGGRESGQQVIAKILEIWIRTLTKAVSSKIGKDQGQIGERLWEVKLTKLGI